MTTEYTGPQIEKHLAIPTLITSSESNALLIRSDFLALEKCSVLLHVLVPKKGKEKPDPYLARFLIGHSGTSVETGRDERGFITTDTLDIFGIRYTSRGWQLIMSNHAGRWLYPFLAIPDRTKPGWRQFLLAWDKTGPLLTFEIRGRDGGRATSSVLQFWPEQINEKVSIGAMYNQGENAFVESTFMETQLAHLWIVPDFLTNEHPLALQH